MTTRAGSIFAVAVDDPSDENHVVSFSGENGKRADDNSYGRRSTACCSTPRIGRRSTAYRCRRSRPPSAAAATGNFAARKVNDVTCSATDNEGRTYQRPFVSDGKPVSVRRIRQSSPSIQDPFK